MSYSCYIPGTLCLRNTFNITSKVHGGQRERLDLQFTEADTIHTTAQFDEKLESSDHPPRPSLTAPEIERPAFLCFQKLEVRLAAEPATGHGPDDPICHRSFRIRDLNGLPARTGCRSICH